MFKTFACALFAAVAAAKDGKDFKGDAYIGLTRQAKSDKIWSKVMENTKSGSWHFVETLFVGQDDVFDTKGDEFDCGFTGCRDKTIHSVGVVGKVKWVNLGGHNYTGIFKGGDSGYARFSSAKPVDVKGKNMTPGMGVKFLRDGHDSANFVAMYSVDGQSSFNMFEHDWHNHIPDPKDATLIPLELRFKTATDWIQTVGLSEMAAYDQQGKQEASPLFPWMLRFAPTGQVSFPSDTYDVPFEQYMQTIPSGTTLYDIWAWDKPEELGGTQKKIGEFVTESQITTSYWGDEHMYFRHERMDDDLKIKPEWEPYTPNPKVLFEEDGSASARVMSAMTTCPFARFFGF